MAAEWVEKIETGEGRGHDVAARQPCPWTGFSSFTKAGVLRRGQAPKVLHALDTAAAVGGVDVQGGEPPPRYRHTLTRIGAGLAGDSQPCSRLVVAQGEGDRDRGPTVLECSLRRMLIPSIMARAGDGGRACDRSKVAWHSVSAHDVCNRPAEPSGF